jgi:predicted O-methyltransferase YrrM
MHSPEQPLLQQINRETHLHVLKPQMLSGAGQGVLLSMFSKMLRPKRILEIGTYTGYSAICLAEGLAEGGILITIDRNEELETRVRQNFEKAKLTYCIDFRIGKALDIIPKLEGLFDLIFIDADKGNYLNYYQLAIDKLRPGGLIITDNVLWYGKVADPAIQDKQTTAIRAFNEYVQADERVDNVLLPYRDGLMLAYKK